MVKHHQTTWSTQVVVVLFVNPPAPACQGPPGCVASFQSAYPLHSCCILFHNPYILNLKFSCLVSPLPPRPQKPSPKPWGARVALLFRHAGPPKPTTTTTTTTTTTIITITNTIITNEKKSEKNHKKQTCFRLRRDCQIQKLLEKSRYMH
jgi:hypothetical protein